MTFAFASVICMNDLGSNGLTVGFTSACNVRRGAVNLPDPFFCRVGLICTGVHFSCLCGSIMLCAMRIYEGFEM